jgi:hypothetical protein
VHQAFLVLGGLTVLSTIVFRELKHNDGASVSQQKVIVPDVSQEIPGTPIPAVSAAITEERAADRRLV